MFDEQMMTNSTRLWAPTETLCLRMTAQQTEGVGKCEKKKSFS